MAGFHGLQTVAAAKPNGGPTYGDPATTEETEPSVPIWD